MTQERRFTLNDYYTRKIVELVKQLYTVQFREQIAQNLSLLLYSKGVSESSIIKIIDILSSETRDNNKDNILRQVQELLNAPDTQLLDSCKEHLIDTLQEAIMQLRNEEEEDARDKSIHLVEEIEKLVKTNKYIHYPLIRSYLGSGRYFVNDPRRGILLLRMRETRDGLVPQRRIITSWYIHRVHIIRSESAHYFKVVLRSTQTGEKLVISGTIDDIIARIKRSHGIKDRQHLFEAFSSLLAEFARRNIAHIKKTPEAAGIYYDKEGNLRLVKNAIISKILLPEPDIEKARKALQYLVYLRSFYDYKKYDLIINYATYAPVSYALKKRYGIKQYYLFLHGERQSGKTTLARIITSLYPVIDTAVNDTPEEALSEFRLGYVLNLSTFPYLVDEVEGISNKPSLLSLLKRAASGTTARWRGDINKIYYARAPLVFTSNRREVFTDPALLERLILIEFDYNDYVYRHPKNILKQFKQAYTKYRELAPYLGRIIVDTIIENTKIINELAYSIHEKEDAIRLGKYIWRLVCKKLGIETVPWIESDASPSAFEESTNDYEKQILFETLLDIIRESALRSREHTLNKTLQEIITSLYEKAALPGFIFIKDNHIVVTSRIIKEIQRRYDYYPPGGLKQLSARLGYKYTSIRVGKQVIKGMIIPLSELEDFTYTTTELPELNEQEQDLVNKILNTITDIEIQQQRNIELTPELVKQIMIDYLGIDKEQANTLINKIYPHIKKNYTPIAL